MEAKETEQKTREEIAMGKLFDPWRKPYPYWHERYFSEGKLAKILEEGLVAWRFAARANIKGYERNMKNPWNNDYVSLATKEPREITQTRLVFFVDPNKVDVVDPDTLGPNIYEPFVKVDQVLVKNRISPREFIGVLIPNRGESWDPVLSYEEIDEIMSKLKPDHVVPVFSAKELVWPRRMSHEEIVQMLAEQEEKV